MKYKVRRSGQFKKSFKLAMKRGKDPELFKTTVSILANTGALPESYLPHRLHGNRKGVWDCHIEPDWLLLWEQYDDELVLILTDTGTHSDLFKK